MTSIIDSILDTPPLRQQSDCKSVMIVYDLTFNWEYVVKAWTLREEELIKLFLQAPLSSGMRVPESILNSQVKPVHTPRRVWNLYYNPRKIQESWDKTNFDQVVTAIDDYFNRVTTLSSLLRTLKKHIHGCGNYGAGNLARMLHLCKRTPMPGDNFLKMSSSNDEIYSKLKELGISNVSTFNQLHPTFNYDCGEIAYICCMSLGFLKENKKRKRSD